MDRDGVINRAEVREGKPYPPANLEVMELLPGVSTALQALYAAGWILIVVTNQPDVARGATPRSVVEAINLHLKERLPIEEFWTCYHDSGDGCDCRKPLPGALLAAARKHTIDLKCSFMVGDRWRDVEAGQRAGCKTVFIDYDYAEKQPKSCDYKVKSLLEAATIIIGEMK